MSYNFNIYLPFNIQGLIMIRVRCISVRRSTGDPLDPLLIKGKFYEVVSLDIRTIADETPYIRIKIGQEEIDRPRHLFGRLLNR